MRSRVVRVSPLATHRRRRPLVLKVSFLGPPRTGSPGQLRPLAGGAELSRKRPLTRRPAAKAHSSTTTLRAWRTTQIRDAICGKTRPYYWVIGVSM